MLEGSVSVRRGTNSLRDQAIPPSGISLVEEFLFLLLILMNKK